jgi:hypothetical protein
MKATIYRKLTLSMILFMLVSLTPGAMRPGPVSAQGAAAGAQQAPPSAPRTPAYPVSTAQDYKSGAQGGSVRVSDWPVVAKTKSEQPEGEKKQPQPEQPKSVEQPAPIQQIGAKRVGSPTTAGVCDTAGPIEVESSGGTAAGVPTAYATLTLAFTAINGGTLHTGVITIDVCGNTNEATATATLNASGSGPSYTSITIAPAGGAARTITGATTAGNPLIDFNGADNVTIDGLNTGGNSLTIANTTASATSGTSTIRFIGGATNNTITNSTISGSFSASVTTNGGNIFFSTDTLTANGNDNNTISNNNIGPAGANLPTKGIYLNGSTTTTAINNSGILVNNNNIFDYFGAAVASAGIYVSTGNTDCNFTNNKFYQTGTRTQTTGAQHSAIWIANSSGNNFLIGGNTIGFAASNGTGTYGFVAVSSSSVLIPIFLSVGTTTATSVQGNTIAGIAMSGAGAGTSTSAAFRGIYVSSGLTTVGNVTGNTIGSQSATGSISYTTTSASASDVIAMYNFGSNNWTVSNNTIGGITAANTNATPAAANIYGIRVNTASTVTFICQNNTIGGTVANSIQSTSTATGNIINGILNSNPIGTISGNTIRNMTAAGGTGTTTSSSVIGIASTATSANHTVTQNTIHTLTNTNATAATTIIGLHYNSSTGTNLIAKNFIHSFSAASTSAILNGINVGGGTATYQNNMIRLGIDAGGNSITTALSINGINEPLAGTDNFYFNSVYIGGTGVGTTASNTFAFNSTQTTVTRAYQDNIFVNARSNATTGGKHYAIRVGGTTANPTGLTSNYNILYAPGTGGVLGLFNAIDQPTLAAWRTATGQDNNSISADPQFINPTGTSATVDLHIHPTNPTPIEAAGILIASVADDFDGQTRASFTPTDIGADAGNFTPLDLSGPIISYTPLGNSSSTANRTLSGVTITDSSGVNTSPGTKPRMYFKKLTNANTFNDNTNATDGWKYVEASNASSPFSFTTDYSLLFGGPPITGDTIQYFVVAQDLAPTPNVSINSGSFATQPSSVSLTSANFPITGTINSYIIAITYAGPYTVGTGGTYTTLKAFFDAVNAGVVVGNITVNVVGDSTETATAVLNQWAEESGSGFTMLIQPSGGARTISGNITGALIKLNGADRVTIDGLITGGNSLTLINNSTTSPSAVVWLSSLGLGQGATNNTIRFTTITGGAVTSGIYGVALTGTTLVLNGEDNDNNSFERDTISKVSVGILASGTAATSSGGLDGLSIIGNLIGPAVSGATNTGFAGIQVANALGVTITDNGIRNLTSTTVGAGAMNLLGNINGATIARNTITNITSSAAASGINSISAIYLGAAVINVTATRNIITTVASTTSSGYGARAIILNTGLNGSNITLANNTITDVFNYQDASEIYWTIGIDIDATGGVNLYHNSINLFGSHTGFATTGGAAAALYVNTTGTGLDVRDNIFSDSYDSSTSTSDKAYAVYSLGTNAIYSNINYNDYYVSGTGTPVLGFLTSDRTTLAAWQSATLQDANSQAVNPLFVSATDLHLQGTSPLLGMGTLISGIDNDVDNDLRDSAPDIGADEIPGSGRTGTIPAGTYRHANIGAGTLGGNVTIQGNLTLSGILNTGANTLTLDCGGTVSYSPTAYVIGNVQKNFCATGAFTFPVGTANGLSQLDANVTALPTNPSSLTVVAVQGSRTPPLDTNFSLQRYWTVTENGALTADMTLHYIDPTDIMGNEANYRVIRVIGSTAVSFLNNCPTPPVGQACVDPTANTGFIPGVSEFSDWTLGEPVAPTLARIESVNATRAGDGSGTLVQWKTGYEASNLGFNLYRSEGDKGQRVQVNPSLIAGSAFSAAGAAPAGQTYSWMDTSATSANTRYWIEDVDLNGTRTMHGPYATTVGKQAATGNSTLLSSLGQTQGASKGVERSASVPKSEGPASTRPVTGQPAIKLSVKGEGFYRIGQPELLAAGLNANVDPRNLQLYAEGQQIPIRVNGEADGRLDSRDSLEFYGLGLDTPTTNTHVYWLVAGQQPGQRISQSQAGGNLTTGGSFPYAVERKDRTVYFSSLLNGEAENFFGPVVSSAGVAQTLTVANLDSAAAGQAQLQVTLQGATLQGHSVSVKLNGNNVGTLTFTGRERGTVTISVPNSSLVQGVNTVTLTATGAGSDISLVDSVRLTYAHLYRADADALRFTAQGGSQVTIAGFTGQQVRVLDVTNANAPAELTGTVTGSKAEGYSLSLTVPGAGQRTLVALLNTQASAVSRIAADRPSSWGTSANSADLVIIAHGSMVSSVQPLATLRESQGYKVAIVDVEDVYDEFSYGAHTPQALRDFLTYASNSWQYKPRYLLLAGDSTFDPKDYLNRGDLDLVPTRLIDTQSMETASDDWLAGYNRDGDARLAVGRLPVSTVTEANAVIAKIAGYAPGSTQQKAVLVADNDSDGFSFENVSHAIANLISRHMQVLEITRSGGTTSEVRQRILDAINAGPMLVNYMGHGNVDTWTGAGLLTSADANALTNGNRLPFFVMMTCLNGYTQDPTFSSLAEALVRAPNGGAIASWASSGMTTPEQQAAMSQELYAAIFSGTPTHDIPLPIAPTLGDAIIRAKASISNPDVRNTWILFGDPTTKLR